MAPLDLLGQTFNHWKVIGVKHSMRGRTYWPCRCSCGTTRFVDGSNLKQGVSKSCGCQHKPHTSTDKHKAAAAANSRTKATRLQAAQLKNYKIAANGCWLWNGPFDKDGYGKIKRDNKSIRAHRLFFETHKEPLPPGRLALHTCDTPACVNPEHLYSGTQINNEHDKNSRERRRNQYGAC